MSITVAFYSPEPLEVDFEPVRGHVLYGGGQMVGELEPGVSQGGAHVQPLAGREHEQLGDEVLGFLGDAGERLQVVIHLTRLDLLQRLAVILTPGVAGRIVNTGKCIARE